MSGFGSDSFGADSFGVSGEVVIDMLADGVGLRAQINGIAALYLRDGISVDSALVGALIHTLNDRVQLTGAAFPSANRRVTTTDGIAYADALAVAWQMSIAEGLNLVGEVQSQTTRLATLVDTLHATGVVATRVDALAVVATVLGLNGMLATGWKLEAVDTVAFQDALAHSLNVIGSLVDSAGFADTPSPAMRITAVMSDSIAIAADPQASLEAVEVLRDEVLFYVTLRLGDAEFAGWVLSDGAPSEYRNYPFNGFVAIEGTPTRYYGTADDGLYLLEGDTDDGDPIDAWVSTALMDFGTGKFKRVPDVYISFIGGNKVLLKVVSTDRHGVQREDIYESDVPAGSSLHNGRLKPGRGLESRYWQFQIRNVAGGYLQLDQIQWRPLTIDRRI